MAKRGRKSPEELSVTVNLPKRAESPDYLKPEAAKVWDRITKCMPVGWFPPETHDLLADYARHKAFSDLVAERIEEFDVMGGDAQELNKLSGIANKETDQLKSLATKLRITNQSRVRAETAGRQLNNNVADGVEVWNNY